MEIENGASRIFLREGVMEIAIFGVVSKTFVGKLFARNGAFREMERQCADRIMKMGYPLEVGFKADLTSKVLMGVESFCSFRQD